MSGEKNFYGAPAPPPPYSATVNTNYTNTNTKKTSSGLFGNISKAFSDIGSTVDSAARDLTNIIDKAASRNIINTICCTGNIIQLSPKTFGTCLQILADQNGYLFVNARGPVHPQAYNTHWSVYMEPGYSDIIKLYNQDNYLSIANNVLALTQSNNPAAAPVSTRFKVRQNDNCLSFESLLCPKFFITFDNTHSAVIARDISLLSNASYFHPTLVYAPVSQVKR